MQDTLSDQSEHLHKQQLLVQRAELPCMDQECACISILRVLL